MQAAILAAAIVLWAAVHSLLAADRVKMLVVTTLGATAARWYRLVYNLFSAVSLLPIAWLMWRFPDRELYAIQPPWAYGMMMLQVAAVAFAGITLLQTDALSFAGLSQVLGGERRSRLTTSGFYAVVRHPLYLFALVLLWSSPRMGVNQLVFAVASTIYFFIGALLEERRLLREFGQEYRRYRARTPMIVPGLRPRRSD